MFRAAFARLRSETGFHFRRFKRDESGAYIIWSLFTVLAILMATGLGITVQLHEVHRTKLQNTLDSAVLAATDLDQDQDPMDVLREYMARAGMPDALGRSRVIDGLNYRTTYAIAQIDMPTFFLMNADRWKIQARSEANEVITDVEVVLVLDNSGSMGWDNDYRLNLLKPAASNFVDAVMREDDDQLPGSIAMSIVPFSTQVNAGPELGSVLNFSGQHGYNHCARFATDDFNTVVRDPETQFSRAGHFDIWTWDNPVDAQGTVCPFDDGARGNLSIDPTSRFITAWSQDADELKDQIENMWAGGNTSIDVATKWGATLLDPSFRPVLEDMIDAGYVDDSARGQPFDYTRPNTLKVLVVMSDGQNTSEFRLRSEYRSGNSPVYFDPDTGRYSYRYRYRGNTYYYSVADARWKWNPDGGGRADRLTYPQLFDHMSVRKYSGDVLAAALGGSWTDYFYDYYTSVSPGTKDTRTSAICKAARDAGAIVYTIGMDTYGQGDATLSDCAGTDINFYDIEALEIAEAFSSIARQINQLRLTQ